MAHLANLIRWEWFKLQRRWMPWVLLAIMALFSQLVLWVSFASYSGAESTTGPRIGLGDGPRGRGAGEAIDCSESVTTGGSIELREICAQWRMDHQEQLQEMRNSFTLPGALVNALTLAQGVGLLMIAIMTASAIGTDYGWGTLRSVLARGTGRWQYLAAKLGLMVIWAGGALLVVAVLASISAAIAGSMAGGSVSGSASWMDSLETFGRMWLALLPYIGLAAAVGVLTGSAAAGIGISLAYQFAENIAVAILINVVSWFHNVADYLLARNIAAWTNAGSGGGDGPFGGGFGTLPGQWHALAVMAGYTVVLCAIAFWLFQRRDVKGPSGG